MTLHTDGDKLTAPLRQDHDGNLILSIEEYRQHLIHDHGYTEADFLPPERPDNLAQWRALDAKHEAARRAGTKADRERRQQEQRDNPPRKFTPEPDVEAYFRSAAAAVGLADVDEAWATASKLIPSPVTASDLEAIGGALRANVEDRDWTVDGVPLFPTLPEDGSEVRISMEPDPDGTPTLDVAQEQEAAEGEPTSVLLGAARILSWYALPITGIIVQTITARRHPDLRAYLTFMAAWNAATTACRTIELHNQWQNRQATR